MTGRPRPTTRADPMRRDPVRLGLVVGALGVVFGDIGTSPIYTLQTVFNPDDPHPVPVSTENVYGVASLVFWSVTIIVTVTYVLLAMRADNDGEGGIMALITLLRRWSTGEHARLNLILAGLGIFGAALFFGDSMITPAISVLSAVEGVKIVEPSLAGLVVPIAAVILLVLFLVQRRGTALVGRLFGPVMITWFVVIAVLGLAAIIRHPGILWALSPTHALTFVAHRPHIAFFSLAAIVLSVTGAEALYADMGHFGRRAITRGWVLLVFPALMLCYLGQAALILDDPANISGPFFLLAPGWARLPLVLLATAATVIASQAVITGAYSVASQAAQLGYLPRLRVTHTSPSQIGQIYVPWINWFLLLSVLVLVFTFRSSTSLAFAYGVAVTGTITITTLLFFVVARRRWRRIPLWGLIGGAAVLLTVDLLFFAANLSKLLHGAWLPLLIGLAVFTVMVTWQRGREIVTEERERREGSLREFVEGLRERQGSLVEVPGTAVFLNRGKKTTPLALRANVEHNKVRHHHVLIVSIEVQPMPRVADGQRIAIDDLGYRDDGIFHVAIRSGYMERPDVARVLRGVPAEAMGELRLDEASYFLSKVELRIGRTPRMARWRTRLFLATAFLTADAADYFRLPRERTITLGSRIEV